MRVRSAASAIQVVVLFLSALAFTSAAKSFVDHLELQDAVDSILLSGRDTEEGTQVEATYGPIEEWDVSQVEIFANLFSATTRNPLAATANFDLSQWDVSSAIEMNGMFLGASQMDFDVSSWDVSRNEQFQGMFEGATSFQGRGLDNWDVSNGKLFMVMLAETESLLPELNLQSWNIHNAQRLTAMFRNSNFGAAESSATALCDWAWKLAPTADTEKMFFNSKCPDTSDPQLLTRSSSSVSFCVPCGVLPPPTTPEPLEKQSSSDRPNVLLIMADQMRFDMIRSVQDTLEHYDDHFKIDTPNLDNLKEQGVYFESAYCQCAVCAPARTSLRSGCTIERTGVQHNDLILEDEYRKSAIFTERIETLESIDHILVDELGYVSEYYGKWHMPETLATSKTDGRPILQNNDYDFETDSFFYEYEDTTLKLRRDLAYFEELGLIDRSLSDGQQLDPYTKFPYTPIELDARYGLPPGTEIRGQSNAMGRYELSEDYTPTFFEGTPAVKALSRLREQRRTEGTAWFLTASFHSPHAPFIPAWKHLEKYWDNRSQLLIPPSLTDNMDDSAYKGKNVLPGNANARMVQEWAATYYALIEEVDDYVGLLLDALGDDVSNTLVIFTSDHGEMLGSHGMKEKNNFYEESSHVPLLMSFPGEIEPGTLVTDHAGHIDIVATILDFVGAPDLDRSDGTSLRPMIQRNNDKVNRDFDQAVTFGEWDYRKVLGDNPDELERRIDDRPGFMVVKGTYKLMMQKLSDSQQVDMMFNLAKDPLERNDLLGRGAMDADTSVIEKAEHRRCLLLDWMERLDGGVNGDRSYFSDTANNYNDRGGDINEIRNRQQWRRIGLWTSAGNDDPLIFGKVSWTGSEFVRHEWLYVGTRQDESFRIDAASITGKDGVYFEIDESAVAGRIFGQNACESIRITFRANVWAETDSIDAALQLTLSESNGGSEMVRQIPLTLEDFDLQTRRSLSDEIANDAPGHLRLR